MRVCDLVSDSISMDENPDSSKSTWIMPYTSQLRRVDNNLKTKLYYLCEATLKLGVWVRCWRLLCCSDLSQIHPGEGFAKKFSSSLGDSPACLRYGAPSLFECKLLTSEAKSSQEIAPLSNKSISRTKFSLKRERSEWIYFYPGDPLASNKRQKN